MKHLTHFILALMLTFLAAFPVFAAGPSYRIEVAGLACPFCAYGIEKKLTSVDGVEKVNTHIKEGAVIVIMEEGAAMDEATARKAVREAGFTLNGFERAREQMN